MTVRILFVGDVVGSPGRKAVRNLVPRLVETREIHLVVVNAENAAGGAGTNAETASDLLGAGADALTGGNHTWRHRDVAALVDRDRRVLRPINYPPGTPGAGSGCFRARNGVEVGVISALGRVFMTPVENPFTMVADEVARLRRQTPVVVVDFHAEATSEKRAMAHHLDGKASAVVGTHTHVQTADEQILPEGTAFLTDLGMTGPHDSILGVRKEPVLERFLTLRPTAFSVAKRDVRLCGAIVDVDAATGKALAIERLALPWPPADATPAAARPSVGGEGR